MARSYSPLYGSIWNDRDFTSLPSEAQRVYVIAFSQPNISWCGVVPFTERRWASYAPDTTTGYIADAVNVLIDRGYVLLDPDTEELWVRSFIKYGRIVEQKQLHRSLIAAVGAIASPFIYKAVFDSLPDEMKEQVRSPVEACPQPPARLIGGSDTEDLDLDLNRYQEGESTPAARPSSASDLLASGRAPSLVIELDQIVMTLCDVHGPTAVEGAIQRLVDDRRRFPFPSDAKKALERILGPVEQSKPSPLDSTAAAARRLAEEGTAYSEQIASLPRDPNAAQRIREMRERRVV